MDHHVPRAITAGVRVRGVDVLTAAEDGTALLADPALLDRTSALNRVLFSQDEDLLVEATRRQVEGVPFTGVMYGHQLRAPIGVCVRDLTLIASVADPVDLDGQVLYLPL